MAIQSVSVDAAEHDWFATRSGLAANAPLNDHKITYFGTKGFGSNASIVKNVSQLEEEWLNSVAGGAGGGPYETWCKACTAQSVAVGRSINECKYKFYTSVASGTNP